MATWGAHIRIAENILEEFNQFDKESFMVGSIGPDCGVPNEDWSQFSPPKKVSHWLDGGDKIDASEFFESYLGKTIIDNRELSFLLGYYIHLLTDIEWNNWFQNMKKNNEAYARVNYEPKFIWVLKKDWYDLDHLYFSKNQDCMFYDVFCKASTTPNYLSYFPEGAINNQVEYIKDFYCNYKRNSRRFYEYLKEADMDSFVNNTANEMKSILRLLSMDNKINRI